MTEPRVALVTGAASGIGRASVIALARSGFAVVAADVDVDGVKELAAELDADVTAAAIDVRDPDSVTAAVTTATTYYGRLDAAVNSAGIQGALAPLIDSSLDNWERTIGVNLTGTYLCMRAEAAAMLETGGSIVNIASNFGLVGKQRIAAYCASKHGVVGLTKSAALDYAAQRIRINAVCPGPIDTPLLQSIAAAAGAAGVAMRTEVEASVPMGRVGEPEEVAALVAWLCSDSATFVTGAALPVDGGFVTG